MYPIISLYSWCLELRPGTLKSSSRQVHIIPQTYSDCLTILKQHVTVNVILEIFITGSQAIDPSSGLDTMHGLTLLRLSDNFVKRGASGCSLEKPWISFSGHRIVRLIPPKGGIMLLLRRLDMVRWCWMPFFLLWACFLCEASVKDAPPPWPPQVQAWLCAKLPGLQVCSNWPAS